MTVLAAGYIHSLLSIVVLFIASVVVVVWGGEENSMGEKLYVWERENHMCCGNLGEGGGRPGGLCARAALYCERVCIVLPLDRMIYRPFSVPVVLLFPGSDGKGAIRPFEGGLFRRAPLRR